MLDTPLTDVNPWILILGSLGVLVGALWAVRKLGAWCDIDAEIQRKLIHISLGLYCMSFPYVFQEAWQVAVLCVLAIGLMSALRLAKDRTAGLGAALHTVQRDSFGELFFAVSVAVLFFLKGEQNFLYLLPIAILTLADAAAAVIGSQYGRKRFRVDRDYKSLEGVVAFFMTAWLVSIGMLLHFSEIPRDGVIVMGFIVALYAATIEADSWWGLDNVLVPLGVYFLLNSKLWDTTTDLLEGGVVFLSLLAAAHVITRRTDTNAHVTRMVALILFCIWITVGTANLLTALLVVGAHFILERRQPTPSAAHLHLPIILVVMGMSWLLAAQLLDQDLTLLYHLSFAIMAAATLALAFKDVRGGWLGAAAGVWTLIALQLWWSRDTDTSDITFLGIVFGLIAGAAFLAPRMAGFTASYRIYFLGLLGMIAAGLAYPVSIA